MTQGIKRRGIPLWVVIVLLLDIAALIVAWHIYQKKKERYDPEGFSLADEPRIPPEEELPPAPPEPPSQDPARFLEVEPPRPPRRPEPAPETRQTARPPAAAAQPPKETSKPMSGNTPAERYYFALLKAPYFKKSKTIQAWKREFKAYPDLRAINERYHKDRNPFSFVNGVAKSPNFQRMMGKYLPSPDIQKFLQVMAGSPAVVASAGSYMKDGSVAAVARDAGLLNRLRSPQQEGQPRLKTLSSEPPEQEE